MIVSLSEADQVYEHEIGGKAYNLHKLIKLGLPVPKAFAIPATVHIADDRAMLDRLLLHINSHEGLQPGSKYAVRSSGVGEDREGDSYAGIFDSYLNIPHHEILPAIQKVWESVGSSRSRMYSDERSTAIEGMGVVIQEMVEADHAGVAFSVCPVEKDERIALIEVVAGLGESLVSGQRTPATLRVNKLTGMCRIQRHGADNLADKTLEEIAELVVPLIERIEDSYGSPVDVEWAISDGEPFILQARPITA